MESGFYSETYSRTRTDDETGNNSKTDLYEDSGGAGKESTIIRGGWIQSIPDVYRPKLGMGQLECK